VALSVIGAGFGRTGTLSLKVALEKLGVGPCYHMLEVIQKPEHAAVWNRAADGGEVDWDWLLADYRSAVDWPACSFWREFAELWPEARVVLTVRDPERWYASAHGTIYQAMTQMSAELSPAARAQLSLARKIVLDRTFGGRFEDRDHAIEVYLRHNEEVERAFGPERLLVYEVAQGWQPLADFLGRRVPDEPFPRVNTTDQFQAGMQRAYR